MTIKCYSAGSVSLLPISKFHLTVLVERRLGLTPSRGIKAGYKQAKK